MEGGNVCGTEDTAGSHRARTEVALCTAGNAIMLVPAFPPPYLQLHSSMLSRAKCKIHVA